MYAFFRLDGHDDSLATAKRLVARPGWAWRRAMPSRPRPQGWLRWCFASEDPQRLVQGVERLRELAGRQQALGRRGSGL